MNAVPNMKKRLIIDLDSLTIDIMRGIIHIKAQVQSIGFALHTTDYAISVEKWPTALSTQTWVLSSTP